MVVLCGSQQQAGHVKARLAEWLGPRGLAFNEDKTKIVHLTEGFDFLGFNVRRYRNGKLLIKPSDAAVRRLRARLADEMRALRGSNAAAVLARPRPGPARGTSAPRSPAPGSASAALSASPRRAGRRPARRPPS